MKKGYALFVKGMKFDRSIYLCTSIYISINSGHGLLWIFDPSIFEAYIYIYIYTFFFFGGGGGGGGAYFFMKNLRVKKVTLP